MDIKIPIASLQNQIKDLRAKIAWLRKHRKILKQLPPGYFCGDKLDFDHLEHKDIIKVIRALGGKWKKSKNDNTYEGGERALDRVDYEQKIDGVAVRCYAGKPPPSCRIVEYEEVIPARVVPAVPEHVIPEQRIKKKKMICTGVDDPMLVSMARVAVPLTDSNNNAVKLNGES